MKNKLEIYAERLLKDRKTDFSDVFIQESPKEHTAFDNCLTVNTTAEIQPQKQNNTNKNNFDDVFA